MADTQRAMNTEQREPKSKNTFRLLCEIFSQAPLGRQSRSKWFMRDNKACLLFVLDKCYTKQKLTNLMMANKERWMILAPKKIMHLVFSSSLLPFQKQPKPKRVVVQKMYSGLNFKWDGSLQLNLLTSCGSVPTSEQQHLADCPPIRYEHLVVLTKHPLPWTASKHPLSSHSAQQSYNWEVHHVTVTWFNVIYCIELYNIITLPR